MLIMYLALVTVVPVEDLISSSWQPYEVGVVPL